MYLWYITYMWFFNDTFSLNNMFSYYTCTYIAWLRWRHTCTIIIALRWQKSPGMLCCPMPKAQGDIIRAFLLLRDKYCGIVTRENRITVCTSICTEKLKLSHSEMPINLYLAGRNVVFTDRNGVSLSGEVCLNHTDVPQVWLMVCFMAWWICCCFNA